MDCSVGLVDSVIYLHLPNVLVNFPKKKFEEIQMAADALSETASVS